MAIRVAQWWLSEGALHKHFGLCCIALDKVDSQRRRIESVKVGVSKEKSFWSTPLWVRAVTSADVISKCSSDSHLVIWGVEVVSTHLRQSCTRNASNRLCECGSACRKMLPERVRRSAQRTRWTPLCAPVSLRTGRTCSAQSVRASARERRWGNIVLCS